MEHKEAQSENEAWALVNGVHAEWAEGYNDRHHPNRTVKEAPYPDNPLQQQAYEKGAEDAEFDEDRIAY